MEKKKYQIIYADPPWKYQNSGGQGVAENHYRTMGINDICLLPVDELAAKNSLLFLWATFPQLQEALQVINAWGFDYKTVAFVWCKGKKKSPSWFWGLGYWTRSNAEVCLLATKGKPVRQDNRIHQLVVSPVREHSRKLDEVRKSIVQLAGDLPRIELFARQKSPGWDVWGNEIKSDISLSLPESVKE